VSASKGNVTAGFASEDDRAMSSSPALLDLRRITVMRGDRAALVDVDLRIGDRERVCILGPNGCGKSTLIKTITRECYPVVDDGSSMAIYGQERWDVAELRSFLGIVSPDLVAACTGDATGRDVVLSGFFSSTRIFPHHDVRPLLRARADAALDRAGIAHLADRPVSAMSSGEAKRALVARALVHEPRALLFDEPTNALDVGARAELLTTMRNLARAGLGIVLVTHHVADIVPEIDRVILLSAGRIVDDGPRAGVLTEDKLSALFGVPVRLVEHGGYAHVV
jgi:iron complex transport system ATP-binding protein